MTDDKKQMLDTAAPDTCRPPPTPQGEGGTPETYTMLFPNQVFDKVRLASMGYLNILIILVYTVAVKLIRLAPGTIVR